MSVTLGQIAARLARAGLLRETPPAESGWDLLAVRTVSADSRRVTRGALFCAVAGTREDSHRYLVSAEEAGAVAAVVERRHPSFALPQLVVSDGRLAAAHAAAERFSDPWDELTLVGVTGTNGKTTTAAILHHLLGRRAPAASIGTLGIVGADGLVLPGTAGLTTPGPVQTAEWMRRLVDDGVRGVAMETSSHALHQGRVAAMRFDAAIFTNLSRDHLDYHETFDAYRDAKLRLLDLLKPGGSAVLNVDDPVWREVAQRTRGALRFGTRAEAEIRAVDISPFPGGTEWELHTPDGATAVRLPLYGVYNVSNALGAAAALWSIGWPREEITSGLASLPQVPGRLEHVPGPAGSPTVLIDYAHTPDALDRVLAAVRPLARERLIVVFGAGGDRDPGKRPEMGHVAARGADLVVVTSDN
ncbi:MAG: UDP-N-acetylmuramoyl-L-alanyl-D-glutamate--2,6-diaminopimelate ligase, partial [Gemmatimonadetes bacterium]|nr:UDP-N-acetylmuramoyl-L-alanyl-D-glutamate--2,6-diaminopimelate ligase [Gemmatimonadota bacterium]